MNDIFPLLTQRLNQMHKVLGSLSQDDFSAIKPRIEWTEQTVRSEFLFGGELVDLQNQATLVIESLGRLKDHFKKWLTENGKPGKISENVVDNNFAVALIHDLWNVEKHVELRHPPRSGKVPKLVIKDRGLVIGRGNTSVSTVYFTYDTWTGDFKLEKQGEACVRLNAEVIDEYGKSLGDFEDLCIEAARIWETEMRNSGVQV